MNAVSPKSLWQECRLALLSHSSTLSPRSRQLLQQVVGIHGTTAGYFYGGFTTTAGLRALLQSIGRPAVLFRNLLDFGCGSGRTIRWFKDLVPRTSLTGTDINADAVNWCAKNIPFATFIGNSAAPPLHLPAAAFDLVIGISVLTHLDEELQKQWLVELNRVCKPGGLVLLTIHGEDKAKRDLGKRYYDTFRANGHYYRRATEQPTTEGLPDFYQVAFHSHAYIEQTWAGQFRILGYLQHGPIYSQELVVLQKPDREEPPPAATRPWNLDLPISALDTYMTGVRINREDLTIGGWAFRPSGETVRLSLWLDDQIVDECSASEPSPDVASHFNNDPNATSARFVRTVSIRNRGGGPHMIWMSLQNETFPLCATYFTSDGYPLRAAKRMVRRILPVAS